MQLLLPDAGEERAAVRLRPSSRSVPPVQNQLTGVCCRFEVLMQASMLSSEYDEVSDMHKKVLRVSVPALLLQDALIG